jgi:hypothetical protein
MGEFWPKDSVQLLEEEGGLLDGILSRAYAAVYETLAISGIPPFRVHIKLDGGAHGKFILTLTRKEGEVRNSTHG